MQSLSDKIVIVFVTCGSAEDASKLSEILVQAHLAACVNISSVRSVFEWRGKIENQDEWLMIIKAPKVNFAQIEETVKKHHSYSLPEIISVDIDDSSADYAKWILEIAKMKNM